MSVKVGDKTAAQLELADATKRAQRFEDDLIEFLRKALLPTISPNTNTSRTDKLIETTIAYARRANKILDLCCGWPLLLEKLVADRARADNQQAGSVYVACDREAWRLEEMGKWKVLEQQAKARGIELHVKTADVCDATGLTALLGAHNKGTFDLVLFSYALHEVRPAAIPDLLFTLVELLREGGLLVVIDPEPNWLLRSERWENIKLLLHLEIEWEAIAVWLPQSTYGEILKEFKCTVTEHPVERSQEFWVLHAERQKGFDPSQRGSLVTVARKILQGSLALQLEEQITRYADCRQELKAELSGNQKRRTLNKAVEFFSVCASQARRVETTIELE